MLPDEGIEAAEEEDNHVLYAQPGCVIPKDAWAREAACCSLLEREDGRQSGVYVSQRTETRAKTDAPTAREAAAGGFRRRLAWQEGSGAARS